MFDSLVKELNEHGGGVRAYDMCARAARGRIESDPENAVALLLIAHAAQRFVEAYDDQPLTLEEAGESFKEFSKMVAALDSAHSGGNAEDKIAALNQVAVKLAAALTT